MLEKARMMDGERRGHCLIVEADMDALALLDEAGKIGAGLLVVASPCSSVEGVVAEAYEPLRRRGLDGRETVLLVRELWMNLTGSLGPEDWAAALRVLSPRPFLLLRVGHGGVEKLDAVIERLCSTGEVADGHG